MELGSTGELRPSRKLLEVSCLVSFAISLIGLISLTIMIPVFTNKSGVGESDARTGIQWALPLGFL
jgi:hypothetical protein